jgi:hypothetical protein
MLLKSFRKEIFRPECNPSFESVHCIAHLDQDVSDALPYLNSVLGGTDYFMDPPQVMFHAHGKIIRVGAREIAVNALRDEVEADRILKMNIQVFRQGQKSSGSMPNLPRIYLIPLRNTEKKYNRVVYL